MASLNKVMLIGNLGRDPEVKYLPDGSAVCNFSVATSESWKDKSSGEKKEKTEWHNITIYRQLAEIAGKYLKNGSSVYIEGKLQTRKWQDKETGKDRYTTEIIADSMKMLGKKQDDQNDESYDQEEKAAEPNKLSAKKTPKQSLESFEDDIPF